jgi:acyl carrier protein
MGTPDPSGPHAPRPPLVRGPRGYWGRCEWIEPRVRTVVAEQLGVDASDLVREISLVDELAADSLDLLEIALVLEGEIGVVVSERALESVRTYGELVEAILAAEGLEDPVGGRQDAPPLRVRARVVPGACAVGCPLERSATLTPYTAELIAEDALRAGRGARLEIGLAADAAPAVVAAVRVRFAALSAHGVEVRVRREAA